VNNALYGTTAQGGSTSCTDYYGYPGLGTVFAITTSGKKRTLHAFNGYPSDGETPLAGLVSQHSATFNFVEFMNFL
jgi:hypothetical protein